MGEGQASMDGETRPLPQPFVTSENPQIQVGASPRGGLALVQLARGQALLRAGTSAA